MKTYEEVQLDLAVYLHGLWKDMVRPLLIGHHLEEDKRLQYSLGMCKFHLLDPQYKRVYLNDADVILGLCMNELDTLIDYAFNGDADAFPGVCQDV